MTFEMREILRSKREYRQRLAARPVAEKLRLLDQLRERSLAIAASRAEFIPTTTNRSSAKLPSRN